MSSKIYIELIHEALNERNLICSTKTGALAVLLLVVAVIKCMPYGKQRMDYDVFFTLPHQNIGQIVCKIFCTIATIAFHGNDFTAEKLEHSFFPVSVQLTGD